MERGWGDAFVAQTHRFTLIEPECWKGRFSRARDPSTHVWWSGGFADREGSPAGADADRGPGPGPRHRGQPGRLVDPSWRRRLRGPRSVPVEGRLGCGRGG